MPKGFYKRSKDIGKKISKANKGRIFTEDHRRKISIALKEASKGNKNVFGKHWKLTEEQKEKRRGKNSSSWKGGITSENQKIRDSEEYNNWRLKVFFRDNFTCQKCNTKDNSIQAHHIYNFTNKDLRFLKENGITFCKKCHKLFHHIYGTKNNTVEQLIEFLNNNKNAKSEQFKKDLQSSASGNR